MYALVTYDGYALDVVDGPLDEATAHARRWGATEVVFDSTYDLSDLFTAEIEQLERAANPSKKLRRLEEQQEAEVVPLERVGLRRLSVIPTPDDLSPEAARAVKSYYDTGKFPKGLRPKAAVEILRHLSPAGRLQAAALFQELDPAKAPESAWSAANKIRIKMDDVFKMSNEEAMAALTAARQRRLEGGKIPVRWSSYQKFMAPVMDKDTGLADIVGLLGSNHKLAKRVGRFEKADVMGLSLLPQRLWQLGFDGDNPRKGTFNACIGASPECAQACLVYSGQNTEDANEVKATRMDAFVQEPVAFARILMASIGAHKRDARGLQQPRWDGFVPFVRLNVFSDLPWELIFPELFHYFDDLQFYDYTKVPGRRRSLRDSGVDNYDLTFSWSGMNARGSEWEWNDGGRVAMVFFKTSQAAGFWRTHDYWRGRMQSRTGVPMGPMPARFLGKEVIDGDVTDVRPYDAGLAKGPPPWIVGLRYKPPQGQAFDKIRSLFVVPVEERDGVIFAAVVPRDQPGTMQAQLREAADIRRLELLEQEKLRQAKEAGVKLPAIKKGEPTRPQNPPLKRRLLR